MEKIKWLLSAICGAIATFFEHYGILILLVAVAIVFDLVTGLLKAKASANGAWSSEKCRQGLFKKLALLVGMCFGFFLDWFIPYMLLYINVELPFAMPFSMIISFYIVLNESISICENLYATNPEIMPRWIVGLLTNVKDKIGGEEIPNKEDLEG